MAKRWKYIRAMLASIGYTTIETVEGLDFYYIDSENYVYFTKPDGSRWKSKWNSSSAISLDGNSYVVDDYIVDDYFV